MPFEIFFATSRFNVNKIVLIILLWLATALGGGKFLQDRVLFCMQLGSQPLQINVNGKQLSTGLPALDRVVRQHGLVSMEKWMPMADDRDVVDDVALQNIYVARFEGPRSEKQLAQTLADLRQVAGVHSADLEAVQTFEEINDAFVPDDPYFNRQWYIQKIGADLAWGLWKDGLPGDSTVLVGVVDSGIDYLHPDLAEALYINPGEDINGDGLFTADDINGIDDDNNGYVDDLRGWDFSDDSNQDNDIRPPVAGNGGILSHGTHVAGIIGATANNGIGIAGVSYRSKIIATKHALDDDVEHSYVHNGYKGITYLAKMGAKIINCSWGGLGYSFYEKYTLENAVRNYGVAIICAAGNGGDDGIGDDNDLNHHYPSDFDSAYAVAAINSNDQKTGFSNYGDVINFSAPGAGIYSTIHVDAGSYVSWDGTSMASPVVAGAFALLKAWFPDKDRHWLAKTLSETADDIDAVNTSYAGQLGAGRVNIYNAIARKILPQLALSSSKISHSDSSNTGQVRPGDTLDVAVVLSNSPGWLDASQVAGKLSATSPYIEILDSTALFGDIPGGASAANDADILRFRVLPDAPYQTLDLVFEATANDTAEYNYSGAFGLSIDITNNQAGFPVAGQSISAPLAVGSFGNHHNKIAAITDGKYVTLFQKDGSIQPGFPVEVGTTNAAPILTDMDGDGNVEVVVVNIAGEVKIVQQDGTISFIYQTKESLFGDADAAVANMDDDAGLEIVFGSTRKNMHIIKLDSTELSGFPRPTSHIVNKGVALADITADGRPEIVFGTFDSKLHVWTAEGDTIPGFPVTLDARIDRAPVVSRVDDKLAIVAVTLKPNVLVFNGDGSLRATYPTANTVLTVPALANCVDDAQPEVYFGTADGLLHGMTLDGDSLAGFPIQMESSAQAEPAFADFNNDGLVELVVGTQTGRVFAFEPDGSVFEHFPVVLDEPTRCAPAIADLDVDGDLEIIISGLENLYVLETYGSRSLQVTWPTYMGNNQRTGFYQGAYTAISSPKTTKLPVVFELAQNWPNPFNPDTQIEYRLSQAARVKLAVYNTLGQRVSVLVDAPQAAGNYQVRFHAQNLASGVYFYRFTAGDFVQVRKMMLLR